MISTFAAMAQSVERRLGKAEVVGSSPISSFETSQSLGRFSFGKAEFKVQDFLFYILNKKRHS